MADAYEVGTKRYLLYVFALICEEAERHIAQGKFELAEETLVFLHKHRPKNAQVCLLQGDFCRARSAEQDHDRAVRAYQSALEIDGKCGEAHRGLGLLCRKTKDDAGAVEHFRRYLVLAPDAPDADYIRQYIEKLGGAK